MQTFNQEAYASYLEKRTDYFKWLDRRRADERDGGPRAEQGVLFKKYGNLRLYPHAPESGVEPPPPMDAELRELLDRMEDWKKGSVSEFELLPPEIAELAFQARPANHAGTNLAVREKIGPGN